MPKACACMHALRFRLRCHATPFTPAGHTSAAHYCMAARRSRKMAATLLQLSCTACTDIAKNEVQQTLLTYQLLHTLLDSAVSSNCALYCNRPARAWPERAWHGTAWLGHVTALSSHAPQNGNAEWQMAPSNPCAYLTMCAASAAHALWPARHRHARLVAALHTRLDAKPYTAQSLCKQQSPAHSPAAAHTAQQRGVIRA